MVRSVRHSYRQSTVSQSVLLFRYSDVHILYRYSDVHIHSVIQCTQHLLCGGMQILAPHQDTSVLTQLAQLPDASEINGAVGKQALPQYGL